MAIKRVSSELLQKVFQKLDFGDLKSVRQVNKRFADLVTPLLFATIQFLGPGHESNPRRTAEFSKLDDAINEVLPVAAVALKLIFAPAFFQEGIWDDYRTSIAQEAHEPVDEAEFLYSSEDEDRVEDEGNRYEARVQVVVDRRLARIEEERGAIREAEEHWERKRHEQMSNKGKLEASLEKLFKSMSRLQELEVHPWKFRKWGKLELTSDSVDGPRANASTSTMLHTIAHCLEKSNRHIEKLHIHAFNLKLIEDSSAMHHTFMGLRHLRLEMDMVDALLEGSSTNRVLPAILKHSQPTLQRLEIISGGEHPQLPSRGGHELYKILNNGQTDEPMSFPNLDFFRLTSLLASTTSLLDFLAAQPKISAFEFNYVNLVTSDMGWEYLAARLPESLEKWDVSGRLGQEPFPGFEPPIAYNWCREWHHYREQLPESTGWEGRSLGLMKTRFRRIGAWPPDEVEVASPIPAPSIQAPMQTFGVPIFPSLDWSQLVSQGGLNVPNQSQIQ